MSETSSYTLHSSFKGSTRSLALSLRGREKGSAEFQVGKHGLEVPLVHTRDMKMHLNLLRSFHDLRVLVEDGKDERLPPWAREMDMGARWTWFVQLAVERFQRWLEGLPERTRTTAAPRVLKEDGPPIDVWMVWHSYLLNPEFFADDCCRLPVMRPLASLTAASPNFFFELLGTSVVDILRVNKARDGAWLERTGLPFDPLESTSVLTHQDLSCPRCKFSVAVPYFTLTGTGYAQANFSRTCSRCSFNITKEKLAVAKLISDLATSETSSHKSTGFEMYLPRTLRTTTEAQDLDHADRIKSGLLAIKPFNFFTPKDRPQPTAKANVDLGEYLDWEMDRVQKLWSSSAKPGLVTRVLSAYYDHRPFSIDLVGTVLRQGSFVRKMYELRWSERGFFDDPEDELALHHANARYHAFLDLMWSSPGTLFVPTLDVDLVWHTHQLYGDRYCTECLSYVGRFIDHDDQVEETVLTNSFDATARAWQARYSVPYMHCGCPSPGQTIGQKLSRMVSDVRERNESLLPPSLHPAVLAASHPSEHNSVVVAAAPRQGVRKILPRQNVKLLSDRQHSPLYPHLIRKSEERKSEEPTSPSSDTSYLVPVPIIITGPEYNLSGDNAAPYDMPSDKVGETPRIALRYASAPGGLLQS
ncbi:hypothetical protein BC834DRAFT_355152 [Gloeopeniophorella convolvens]|nr:hypothetical protein BC834DRAFT_355152 [Gloeopeniophorella convolvens]